MGEWSAARPGRPLPPRKTWYPFYRRLGGPQGRSGRGGKSRPHRYSILNCPARSSVAIRTELPGPQIIGCTYCKVTSPSSVLFLTFFQPIRHVSFLQRDKILFTLHSTTSLHLHIFTLRANKQLVEALRYKREGRRFDSRWCHWNFSLT